MRLLILLLQGLLLQGLLVLTPRAASPRGSSKETNASILKLSLALQELVESLSEGDGGPNPPSEAADPEVEAAERARNLTAVLERLAEAVRNNTQALKEGQERGVACEAPFFRVGQECFYVNKYLRVSWSEARIFCQGLRGGDLAQPQDVNQLRAMLLHKFPEDKYRFLWVGATEAMGKEGNWSWLSKTPVPLEEWAVGQPDGGNENCIVLSRDEYPALHDSPCYTHTMFICQAPPAGV